MCCRGVAFGALYVTSGVGAMLGSLYATNIGTLVFTCDLIGAAYINVHRMASLLARNPQMKTICLCFKVQRKHLSALHVGSALRHPVARPIMKPTIAFTGSSEPGFCGWLLPTREQKRPEMAQPV